MRVLSGRKKSVEGIAFDPGGRFLAAATFRGGTFELWDLAAPNKPARLRFPPSVTPGHFAFAADGTLFSASGPAVSGVDPATRKEVIRHAPDPNEPIEAFAVAPAGRRIFVARDFDGPDAPACELWDYAKPKPARVWASPGPRHNDLTESVAAFAAGGKWVVLAENVNPLGTGTTVAGRVQVLDAATGNIVATVTAPGGVSGMAADPAGERFAVRHRNELIGWDGPAATPRVVKGEGRTFVTAIAFHPSGKWLAAVGNDATVRLLDAATWAVAKTYTWDVGKLRSVAFSPDGALAAAGDDAGTIVVWDVDG